MRTASKCRVRRGETLALTYQQRATQNWVKMSWSPGTAAGLAEREPAGANSTVANEPGNNDQTEFADNRAQVGARPRVIHMLPNGFLSIGAEPDKEAWQKSLAGWEPARSCTRSTFEPVCAPTPRVPCDHAAGSGSAAAANWGRNEEPAIRATNRLSAATMAVANCHRRVLPAPQTFTIARMYNTTLGQRLKRAVKTIKVRCVFALMVGLPGAAEPGGSACRAQCAKADKWLLRGLCTQASHDHCESVVSRVHRMPGALPTSFRKVQTPPRARSSQMNRTTIRKGMLNKVVGWFRAGYPMDAPQFGHAALIALCPAAAAPASVSVTSFRG